MAQIKSRDLETKTFDVVMTYRVTVTAPKDITPETWNAYATSCAFQAQVGDLYGQVPQPDGDMDAVVPLTSYTATEPDVEVVPMV